MNYVVSIVFFHQRVHQYNHPTKPNVSKATQFFIASEAALEDARVIESNGYDNSYTFQCAALFVT